MMHENGMRDESPRTIFTIGHSTRSIEDLISLLKEFGISRLADIRRFAGSRRHPQFSSVALALSLPAAGILYEHYPELGGRRRPLPDSPNGGLRNEAFRGYADHMATAEFSLGIERLLADSRPTALMCAEAVPWRCHRNLLADELVRRVFEVRHILGPGSCPHEPLAAADLDGKVVTYPPPQPDQRDLFS
jgi:uncharacterized protein (DUF488 family)